MRVLQMLSIELASASLIVVSTFASKMSYLQQIITISNYIGKWNQ
jgi:hypothetical protein